MAQRIMIKGGRYLTLSGHANGAEVLTGTLVIKGNRIDYIGEQEVDPQEHDEVIDGRGKLYMPGLVNTHGHAAMTLLRGLKDDVTLQVWLQHHIWPTEAKMTAADVRIGAELAVVEMLKSGTTTFNDMYDHMDQVAEVVEATGMRACLNRGIIGLGSEEEWKAKLKESIDFAQRWNRQAGGRITTALAPHAPYTCPPVLLTKLVEAAHELDLPIHTHMSETAREVEENVTDYGARPVEHLLKWGVFSRPAIVAHGVHLNDEEIALLAEHQVGVSHNPGSNLKLASGIARVPELLRAGVKVSLGTDGAASNNNLDMFEEIRLAALLHKGVTGDPTAVPAPTAIRMGTVIGAKSLWLDDVGTLEAGMKADLIALDISAPHLQPEADYVSHIVYSAGGADVVDVWVDGKQVMRSRELLTLDEERVMFEANRASQRLRG